MGKFIVFALVTPLVLGSAALWSDTGDAAGLSSTAIDDLRTPASPAALLLGANAGTPSKPSSPREFAVGLLSLAGSSNYSIEYGPFVHWADSAISPQDYYSGGGSSYLRNFALSFATVDVVPGVSSPTAGTEKKISAGLRTQWTFASASSIQKINADLSQLKAKLKNYTDHSEPKEVVAKAVADSIHSGILKYIGATNELSSLTPAMWDKIRTGVLNDPKVKAALAKISGKDGGKAYSDQISSQVDGVSKTLASGPFLIPSPGNPGVATNVPISINFEDSPSVKGQLKQDQAAIDLAVAKLGKSQKSPDGLTFQPGFAIVGDFTGGDYQNGVVSESGVWLSTDYTHGLGKDSDWKTDTILLARGIFLPLHENQSFGDFGGRLRFDNGTFAISAEIEERITGPGTSPWINDWPDGTHNSTQYTGTIEYKASKDVYVTGTFGKNVTLQNGGQGSLISILGVNFNYGDSPTITGKL